MTRELLNVIVSFNRAHYLRNTVRSLQEIFGIGDVLVLDNGSTDERLLEYLDELPSSGVEVVNLASVALQSYRGGLHDAMNVGLQTAEERGYRYVQFIQDDMQFMWHDPDVLHKVEMIFEHRDDALQVSPLFFKAITPDLATRVELIRDHDCYHVTPYAMSDVGIFPMEKITEHKIRFLESENANSGRWSAIGLRQYSLRDPVLAWIPWPETWIAGGHFGTQRPSPRDYYLKPLDSRDVRSLTERPLEELPFHEDFCVPWGWACLAPYWFTTLTPEYTQLIRLSYKDGRRLRPRYVSRDGAVFYAPQLRRLRWRIAGRVLRALS